MSEKTKNAKTKSPRKRTRPRIAMISTHGYVAAIPPLGAADTGGQVVFVLELSKKLAQLGYNVDIWTRQFEDQPQTEEVAPHVKIIRMPCGGSEFIPKEYLCDFIPEWRQNALRYIKKHKLKYQFINSHYWDAGLAGQAISEELKVPHLHTPHSLGKWKKQQMMQDYPDDATHFEKKYNFKVRNRQERILYHSCEMVIATTPIQIDILTEKYELDPSRISMIPPGYDDNRFFPVSQASRKALQESLGLEKPIVLTLGRLANNKGYDLLVKAFKYVAERMQDVQLHIACGGEELNPSEEEYLAEIKQTIQDCGLENRVTMSGFIPDDDLPSWYRAATLFVMPSRYEPFGMTSLEAMACGTAALVTTQGGLWRAVTFGRNGMYADPFDEQEFGMAIYQVLKYPLLRQRLERMGAHKARSLFTWTGIAQQLVSVAEKRRTRSMNVISDAWDETWVDD